MSRRETTQPHLHHEATGEGFRVREISYAPHTRQAPHAHGSTGITLMLGGSIRESVKSQEEVGQILSVVVKPAGVFHADEVGPEGARTIQILLDAELETATKPGIGSWRWLHGASCARPFLGLYHLFRVGGPPDGEFEDKVLEVLGEVVKAGNTTYRDAPVWLRQAREALDDTLPEGLRVQDLAALSGVHPVSLTRAFRRHYGVSVSEYRRRERVRRAARKIESTDHDLTRIAYEAGFADHPHMSREVRKATSLTPTELREMVRRAKV